MVDILVPKARLKVPRKQVFPSAGELLMRCRDCGGMAFSAHVRPFGEHLSAGRVTVLVCDNCKRVFHVDDKAVLQADGKVDIPETEGGAH